MSFSLTNCHQISHWLSRQKFYTIEQDGHLNAILKNLILQHQGSYEAESWYIALGTQGLPNLVK